MLELLAYASLLLVVMPALFLGLGKMIFAYNAKLAGSRGSSRSTPAPVAPRYDNLHERLVAAAAANPLLPRVFSRSK